MQPGQTINPGDSAEDKPQEPVSSTDSQASLPAPQDNTPAAPAPLAAEPATQSPEQPEQPQTWQYAAEDTTNLPQTDHDVASVSWTASEFIDHDKRATWFLGLAAAAIAAAAVIYVITQDMIASTMIVIAAALFGVTAGRKPNTLEYSVDASGIKIGPRLYPYARFKAFSIIEEGAIDSIQLTPLARLAPPLSLYYPPDQEDVIVGTLANYLPHEERRHDPVDRLMRRIRF